MFSLNAIKPIKAEIITTETFDIAKTVESFHPVEEYDFINKKI